MNKPDQSTLNRFCAMISQGLVKGDEANNPISDVSQIPFFPEETMEWIGTAAIPLPTFDPKTFNIRYNVNGTNLGISNLRFVIATPEKKMRFRSFWWEVTTDGEVFQDGKIRHKGFLMDPPIFRTGMLQRDIIIKILTIPAERKSVKLREFMMFDLNWKNPSSGRLEGKKGRVISDLMMAEYNQRIPVSVLQLWEWYSTGKVKQSMKIKNNLAQVESPSSEKVVEEKQVPKEKDRKVGKKEAISKKTKTQVACPNCGKSVEKGWIFCPDCSTSLPQQCKKCGKEVNSDWKGCPFCGTAL